MIVVSNTSPLTNLAAIGRFELLQKLFGEIHIADGVWQELNKGGQRHPGSEEVESALRVHRHKLGSGPATTLLRRDLDLGEAETLVLALEMKADFVLLDEQEGRHAAVRLGLRPLGVLGILLKAKQHGHLGEIRASLDALRRQAGFFLGDSLYLQILGEAGEKT